MPNLTAPTIDRSRRASTISRALLVSTALFALCGVEFTPLVHAQAYAAPAQLADPAANSLSLACPETAPMRRGPQANVADVDLTALPAKPGSLCVLYAHEHSLAVAAHSQVRHIAKPKPKPKPPAPAPAHYAPPPPSGSGYIHSGEPCGGSRSIVWSIQVNSWSVPPGCFGGIFSVNPWGYSDSAAIIGSYGWCNWWPEAITGNPAATQGAWHSSPWVGAVIHFAPGDQGAGGGGHWGYVESIGPNGWILISEMNMYWRGGGWQKVDYRYIHVDGGTSFI